MKLPIITTQSPARAIVRVAGGCIALGLLGTGYHLLHEWQAPVAAQHISSQGARSSPWRGLPGCLRVDSGDATPRYWPITPGMSLVCTAKEPAQALDAVATLTHAQVIRNALYAVIQPPGAARAEAGTQRETATVNGITLAKGQDATLTLSANATRSANLLATCLTGASAAACQAAGIDPKRFAHMAEGAGVRTLALVDLRVADGAIRALASAHSPCFASLAQSTTGCPAMPAQYREANARRTAEHHALHNQTMLGSLTKPAMALALLRAGTIQSAKDLGWLTKALQTSDTPAFIDRVLCRAQGFPADCQPLAQLTQAGLDLGLTAPAIPLLAPFSATALQAPAAHWLQKPASTPGSSAAWQAIHPKMPDPALLRDCAARRWSVCRGEQLADITAHLWGQGDGKATPISAATAYARLAAAANASQAAGNPGGTATPTLVLPAPRQPNTIAPAHARAIVHGMAQVHTQGGTAHSACVAVLGNSKACDANTTLASKTGTPTFPHDKYHLNQRADHCAAVAERLHLAQAAGKRPAPTDSVENHRCALAPLKWYVVLAKDHNAPEAPYTRVVAVQVERNWGSGPEGAVDAQGDRGINMAAYAALQYLQLTQHPASANGNPTDL